MASNSTRPRDEIQRVVPSGRINRYSLWYLPPFAPARDRVSLLEASRSSGCTPLQDVVEFQPFRRREAKQRPPRVARPDSVARQVPDPEAELGGIDGQAHARFALAQSGLARLELVNELRRTEQVTAQLVSHHHDHAQVKHAQDKRRLNVCPQHREDVPNPARTKNTTLPPTISAFRRSPRRHALTLASATKISISTAAKLGEGHPRIGDAC